MQIYVCPPSSAKDTISFATVVSNKNTMKVDKAEGRVKPLQARPLATHKPGPSLAGPQGASDTCRHS
jgi:hypothetical protein